MVCEASRRQEQSAADRAREIRETLKRLEGLLAFGTVRVVIGPRGELAFAGWEEKERQGVSDVCAYRKLVAAGSFELKRAIQKAETLAGRRLNPQAIAAGVHSHDGGQTFHPGHGHSH